MKTTSLIVTCIIFLHACASSPYRKVLEIEIIENPYVAFHPPNDDWSIHKKFKQMKTNKKANPGIHTQLNSSSYDITLNMYPYKWMSIKELFDKNGDYEARSKYLSNTPDTKARNMEQGIYYDKDWVAYVQNIKCMGSVFSRSGSHLQQHINSKNYSITCGYYHKIEGKRILRIGYRYSYAGGKVRHQNDRTSTNKQVSKEHAENYLKQTVSQLIDTIKIKDIDWDKMNKEGLIHKEKKLDMSLF